MSCLESVSATVNGGFHRTFFKWGSFVGRNPCCVIWTTFLICLLLSARLFMSFGGSELPQESEQDRLWVPQDSVGIDEMHKYEATFSSAYRPSTVIFTEKSGGNVLTSSVLAEALRFDRIVRTNLTARQYDEVDLIHAPVSYVSICGRTDVDAGDNTSATCVGHVSGHGLELWYSTSMGDFDFSYSDAQIAATVDSGRGIDPTLFPPGGRSVSVESIFGGIERDPITNAVVSARSVRLTYLLMGGDRDTDPGNTVRGWEEELNRLVGSRFTYSGLSKGSATDGETTWSSSIVDAWPNTAGATSRELSRAIRNDITAINIAYMLIFVYATLVFSRNSPTTSHALLAASGIVSVGLAVMVGYGLTTLFVPLNPVVNVLPFILIGIGVDDMFILLFAVEAQPKHLDVPTRLGNAMASAGVSITITSITDLFAFALGMTSQLPALAGFCTFAAVGITADFLCQITFFAGWMALDIHREKKQKVDCCPCVFGSTDADTSCVPCCCCPCTYGMCAASTQSTGLKGFIVGCYIPLLRKPIAKAAILIGFAGFTGFSIYAASNLEQDFDPRWFIADDAALQDTYSLQDRDFGGLGVPVYVITPPSTELDYATLVNQQGMIRLQDEVQANEWVEADSLSSWYAAFRRHIHSCDDTVTQSGGVTCVKRDCVDASTGDFEYPYCKLAKVVRDANGETTGAAPAADEKFMVDATGAIAPAGTPLASCYLPPGQFWAYLDQWVEDSFLGGVYASEVVWVSSAEVRGAADLALGVTATRLRAQYKVAVSAQDRVATMMTMRDSVAAADFGSSYAYTFAFLFYEQFRIIVTEAVTNLCLALGAVILITLVMIVNCTATALVALMIVLTDVDILGMMWYWGLSIDSVSVINLVLAIGLALDYSVHIAHAFTQKPGTDRQARVDAALEEMGTPVIHGCLSTFLAVLVLSISNSYVFRVFFRQFFGIVLFGGLHGLVLLPTLLSLFGPAYVESVKDGAAMHAKEMPEMVLSGGEMKSKGSSNPDFDVPPLPPTAEAVSAPPSPPGSESGDSSRSGCIPRMSRASSVVAPDDDARCEA